MLLPLEKGSAIILGYERTINDALIEIAGRSRCGSSWEVRHRQILLPILQEIADMRFGEPPRPRCHGFYSGPLYWHVFGMNPPINMAYRMSLLRERYPHGWDSCDPTLIAEHVQKFHNSYAYGCEEGKIDRFAINHLIAEFEAGCRND